MSRGALTKALVLLLIISLATGGHRSKRWLFINPDAPITLGFLLNMPISLALPTLVDTYGTEDDFYGYGDDEFGYGHDDTHEHARSLSGNSLMKQEHPEELMWEPAYQQELGRLQVYFTYLKVSSVSCQERLICDVASEPDAFSPLSKLLLRELKQTHGPVKPSQDNLFWRFLAASATGYAYSPKECQQYYGSCQHSARQMLNMPVMKLWQYLADNMKIELM